MKENLEQTKIILESLKRYNANDLIVVYNKDTDKQEILLPKRKVQETNHGTNAIYQNLKGEKIKIVKKTKIYITPKKYSYVIKKLTDIYPTNQDYYQIEDLTLLEEELNNKRKR